MSGRRAPPQPAPRSNARSTDWCYAAAMAEHIASGWRPDGDVVYRRDGDRLIGIMPMHCKRGEHILSAVGCKPKIVTRGYPYSDDLKLLQLECPACRVDRTWYLVTVNGTPDQAEWNDEPYRDIEPVFVERPAQP